MSSGLSEFSKWHKLLLLLILLIMKDIFVSENSSICFEILYSSEVIKINVDILYLLVRTCVMIGQFHGPYFTPRPAKFKRQFELKSF